jgi:D-serine deaminase-like pyridoxal phosphate-dependent protein
LTQKNHKNQNPTSQIMADWYSISNIHEVDSPALVIYPDRVKENIRILKNFVPDTTRLRPHVKTNKSPDTCKLMMAEGIKKFKCATIAEGEMLGMIGAPDVLLAYQPVGPRGNRFVQLVKKFPGTKYSCLLDNEITAKELNATAEKESVVLNVFIDLNVGMNRTGIVPEHTLDLFKYCQELKALRVIGLHAYDGHHNMDDFKTREQGSNAGFARVEALQENIKQQSGKKLTIVTGGNTTISIHAKRLNAEVSPGTFIFWDYGYHKKFAEQPFVFAALLIVRVLSKPTPETICVDLGHKSVASENPLTNRVHFLNAPGLEAIGHSEEHLIMKVNQHTELKVGDVLYGVPFHVCPTIALHEFAWAIENGKASNKWKIEARKRLITI